MHSKCKGSKYRRRPLRPLRLGKHTRSPKLIMQTSAPIPSVNSISSPSTLTRLPANGRIFDIHCPRGFVRIPATSHSLTWFSSFRCAQVTCGQTTSANVLSGSQNLTKSDKFTIALQRFPNISLSLFIIEKNNGHFECPREGQFLRRAAVHSPIEELLRKHPFKYGPR